MTSNKMEPNTTTPPFFIERDRRNDQTSWERMEVGPFATADEAELALADASRFPLNTSYRVVGSQKPNPLAPAIRHLLLNVATDGKGTTETHIAIRAYDANALYTPGSQPDELVGGKWGPTYQISLDELTAKVLAILK